MYAFSDKQILSQTEQSSVYNLKMKRRSLK